MKQRRLILAQTVSSFRSANANQPFSSQTTIFIADPDGNNMRPLYVRSSPIHPQRAGMVA